MGITFKKLLRVNDLVRREKLMGSGSNETTRPLGPTILAARKVKKPTLAPTSTTVDPLRNISMNNSVVRSSYHPKTPIEGEMPMSLGLRYISKPWVRFRATGFFR